MKTNWRDFFALGLKQGWCWDDDENIQLQLTRGPALIDKTEFVDCITIRMAHAQRTGTGSFNRFWPKLVPRALQEGCDCILIHNVGSPRFAQYLFTQCCAAPVLDTADTDRPCYFYDLRKRV